MKVQCADVKKVLCSVHKMNVGGNVVVLDGEKSYMQNKESGQKTKIHYEDGQYVMYLFCPPRERRHKRRRRRFFERHSLRDLGFGECASIQSASIRALGGNRVQRCGRHNCSLIVVTGGGGGFVTPGSLTLPLSVGHFGSSIPVFQNTPVVVPSSSPCRSVSLPFTACR